MNDAPTEPLALVDDALRTSGPVAAADALVTALRERRDYDRLFDALLIRARLGLDLPVTRPTAVDDVPEGKLKAFEDAYLTAAREVGGLLLESGNVARAWAYFRTIREPGSVAAALDAVDPEALDYERVNELIDIALHDGANRVAGLRLLLRSHGTCNTVTLADQIMPSLSADDRRKAAAMLVRDVYESLAAALRREVESKLAGVEPPSSVRGLIAGRDWLFENANYHVDTSHLHAVARFARALTADDPELLLAIELAEYGAKLDSQFRYAADPPFDDYYVAHLAYFRAVADDGREASLGYFRGRLESEPDERDRQVIAYVLVDLLLRCDRRNDAAEVAAAHLADFEEPGGFSFASLCGQANRLDLLKAAAARSGDAVRYAAAVIQENVERENRRTEE